MGRKTPRRTVTSAATVAALGLLVLFEATVIYMIATPRVGTDYRAYFIDRSSDCYPRQVSGSVRLGERVSFLKADAAGTAAELKICGWIPAAGTGTYSSGPESRLLFDLQRRPEKALLLELDLLPFVTAAHPTQRVVVVAHGRQIAALELHAGSARRQPIVIAARVISSDGRIELSLRFPDARSPRELGINDDRRLLAVRLIFLKLSAIADDEGLATGDLPRPPGRSASSSSAPPRGF